MRQVVRSASQLWLRLKYVSWIRTRTLVAWGPYCGSHLEPLSRVYVEAEGWPLAGLGAKPPVKNLCGPFGASNCWIIIKSCFQNPPEISWITCSIILLSSWCPTGRPSCTRHHPGVNLPKFEVWESSWRHPMNACAKKVNFGKTVIFDLFLAIIL